MLLEGSTVVTSLAYRKLAVAFPHIAEKIICTGPIDHFSITAWDVWNIAVWNLKKRFWTTRIFKDKQLSIIVVHKLPLLESLNINIFSIRMQTRQWLHMNIPKNGYQVENLITLSTIRETKNYTTGM